MPTYYVAKTGNDTTGDGSKENPWATMAKAEASGANGDTVHVAAGTYTEGTTNNFLTIAKAISWVADGEVIVQPNGTAGSGFKIQGAANNISMSGFTFSPGPSTTINLYIDNSTGNRVFTDCTVLGASSSTARVLTCGNVTFDNCTLHSGGTIINATDATLTVTGCTFESAAAVDHIRLGATYTKNTLITGSTFNGSAANIVSVSGSGNVIVRSNQFSPDTALGRGVYVIGAGATGSLVVEDNAFIADVAPTYSLITVTQANRNVRIESNTIRLTNADYTCSAGSALIYIANQPTPMVRSNLIETLSVNAIDHITVTSTGTEVGSALIAHNRIHLRNTTGHAIMVGGDGSTGAGDNKLDGSIIEYNQIFGAYFYGNADVGLLHAIIVGWNKGGHIRFNYINGCDYGIIIKAGFAKPQDWTHVGGVYYNTIVNVSRNALYAKGVMGTDWYNNTLITDRAATAMMLTGKNEVDGDVFSTNTRMHNNVVYSTNPNAMLVRLAEAGDTDNSFDYNCFHGSNQFDNAGADRTFAQWQSDGYDAHSIVADPQLVSVPGRDYRLHRTSPCINRGVGVGLDRDSAGIVVPQRESPCIGAMEYV
jgi:hypothetical protein